MLLPHSNCAGYQHNNTAQRSEAQYSPEPCEMADANGQRPLLARRYALDQVIGEGAYGVVASAMDVQTNQRVAVKRIRRVLDTYPMATRILRELKFLRLLKGHENVIEVKDILVPCDRDKFNDTFVVFELMPCDLYRVIHSQAALSGSQVRFLMFQLLRGVRYLHKCGVIHRDLKPSNVLVDGDCRLKIIDFGLARAAFRAENDSDHVLWTNYVATRWYRAPELIMPLATNYGHPIDMWSVGCIFAEMLLREPLFPGADSSDQLRRIVDFTGKPSFSSIQKLKSAHAQHFVGAMPPKPPADLKALFPVGTEDAVINLISKMLKFDPDERINAHDALMDDYFKQWREPMQFGKMPRPIDEHDFEFEKKLACNESDSLLYIRQELLVEIAEYHPERRADLLGDGAMGSLQAPDNTSAVSGAIDRAKNGHIPGIINAAESMPLGKKNQDLMTYRQRRHNNMQRHGTTGKMGKDPSKDAMEE